MDRINVYQAVSLLVDYGVRTGLMEETDRAFVSNQIFDCLGLVPDQSFEAVLENDTALEEILSVILDDAVARKVIDDGIASRDLFDTKVMGTLMARPSETIRVFWELYESDPAKATDYFYKLCGDCDYIRRYRIQKDKQWKTKTQFGTLDVTLNLSKPEKDPKAIAAALKQQKSSYPKCLLCHENEGYAGRLDHPARQNLRQIPLTLGGERWYLQYSPYVYYNEHCIVLSGEHRPMKIDRGTFERLFDFIKLFPHYTIGSNADLPIVGGSIPTHDHFQGGRYTFAMERAGSKKKIMFKDYPDVSAEILDWPMSVIRLRGTDTKRIIELSDRLLIAWRGYSDPEADILSETDGIPHNTITPIARMRDKTYEMDLVLRNNRTSEEHPLGIFHPHANLHHIKKENIGLIEVMGLAVFPARLLGEMELLKKVILMGADPAKDERIAHHAVWAKEMVSRRSDITEETAEEIIKEEIGFVFAEVLKDAGVFKCSERGLEYFLRFTESV